MSKDIESILKKTVKIAGVTCIAAGAMALMTSAAAVKAMTEGAKYLKDSIQKIIDDKPEEEVEGQVVAEAPAAQETPVAEEAPAQEETPVEEVAAEEAPAEEAVEAEVVVETQDAE